MPFCICRDIMQTRGKKGKKMFLYETHLHTSPVSKCAHAGVKETVEFYKKAGYDGIFITNHFIDGNIDVDPDASYEEKLEYFCSDFEAAKRLGDKIGIKVFFGIEMSYKGTDFLVYGLDKEWFLTHPEIMDMKKSQQLPFMEIHGALIIHAHPFREASYIDHIRLFPRQVHGVEVYNANRKDFENEMAEIYAKQYGLIPFAGSDNHLGKRQEHFGGMQSETAIESEEQFIEFVANGKLTPFKK